MNALKVKWKYQENVDTERLSLELGSLRAEVVDQDGDRSVWSVTLNSIEVARGSADNLSPEYHFDSAREAAECALAKYGVEVEGAAPSATRYHGFTCPVCGSHFFGTEFWHKDASSNMVQGRRTGHCQENQHSGNGCTFSWDRDDPVAEGVAIYTQTEAEWRANYSYREGVPDTLAEVKPLEDH